ncbi:hypothetical protein, partial [Mycetocola tolaasinivorans]|uniref:hypothetical protein n=1 Tax=Mycetocola tolaasinivorans TaxID=76635 RepID=UPI001C7CF64E
EAYAARVKDEHIVVRRPRVASVEWSPVSPVQDGERVQRVADEVRVESTRDVIRAANKDGGKA